MFYTLVDIIRKNAVRFSGPFNLLESLTRAKRTSICPIACLNDTQVNGTLSSRKAHDPYAKEKGVTTGIAASHSELTRLCNIIDSFVKRLYYI